MKLRYFELGLGNSVEEDYETFEYSMCILGVREPRSFEEANKFIAKDLEMLGYKTVVSITEITQEEAYSAFDIDDNEDELPVFGLKRMYGMVKSDFERSVDYGRN